ncbi:MarR family transcriptional regulator [Paraburkholderia dipogonis]
MPTIRELYRENSSTRVICGMLERAGPLTQTQICLAGDFTGGCACKCLKLLIAEGYVVRGARAMNRHRTSIGPRPWTYVRTSKVLPQAGTLRPAAPTAQELCDVMNSIIRRTNVAA